MAGYIYIPIPTGSVKKGTGLLSFAGVWLDGRKEKNKGAYTVIEGPFLKKRADADNRLSHLTPQDKLYILGHGRLEGCDFIGETIKRKIRSDLVKKITAPELARNLAAEGLPTGFIDLRVFSCGSAKANPEYGNTPFAAALKAEMLKKGYNSIRVTGYKGLTHTDYGSHNRDNHNDFSNRKGVSFERYDPKVHAFPPEVRVASENKVVF